MENTLITGRDEDITTAKAIELFKSQKGGLYFSQKQTKEELVFIVGKNFEKNIVDNCATYSEIIQQVKSTDIEVSFIILDYIQLFEEMSIVHLVKYLNEKNIGMIVIAWPDRSGKLRISSNEDIIPLFNNIIRFNS